MATKKFKTRKLYRSTRNSVLGGVAGGLGEFFDVDPLLFRLLFVATLFFGGAGVIVYVIMWLILPIDESHGILIDESVRRGTDEMKEKVLKLSEDVEMFTSQSRSKKLIGSVLLLLGGVFLLNNLALIHLFDVLRLWPVVLILIGVLLLIKRD